MFHDGLLSGGGQHRFQRLVEGGDVVGLAAGDELAVDHDFFVAPPGAGVAQVGLQAGPAGQVLAFDQVGVDQRPRAVADGGDGLVLAAEFADEGDGFGVQAQLVGIGDAAGQDQGVEVGRVGVTHVQLDLEALVGMHVVEALDVFAFFLGGDERDLGAFLFQEVAGLSVFGLLDAVGHQDGDTFVFQIGAHDWRSLACVMKGVACHGRALLHVRGRTDKRHPRTRRSALTVLALRKCADGGN